jgi:Flp pilus assembly protein TadB
MDHSEKRAGWVAVLEFLVARIEGGGGLVSSLERAREELTALPMPVAAELSTLVSRLRTEGDHDAVFQQTGEATQEADLGLLLCAVRFCVRTGAPLTEVLAYQLADIGGRPPGATVEAQLPTLLHLTGLLTEQGGTAVDALRFVIPLAPEPGRGHLAAALSRVEAGATLEVALGS